MKFLFGRLVRRRVWLPAALTLALLLVAFALPARAEGCPMCRDTTAGSGPAMQRALRRAIPALGIPAGGVFLGILLVVFRSKPGSSIDSEAESEVDSGPDPESGPASRG